MCQVAVSLYNMRQILDSTVTSTINTHTISLNLFLQIGSLWTYWMGYWYKIYPLLLPNNDSMPLSITLLSPPIIVLKLHSSWLINCFPGVVIFFFKKEIMTVKKNKTGNTEDFLLALRSCTLLSTDIKKLLWIAFCAFRIAFNLFLCQGVSVYVGLSACFAIRLPPSILTAVQWTMTPNQFFTHPVCQSFCLCLFTLSPCLSLYLCFSQSIYQSVYPFAHEEMDIGLCCDSTS